MVRDTVEDRFDDYLDEMLGYARDELVGNSINPVRHREMRTIETEMYQQRDIALDYAEDIAAGKKDARYRTRVQTFLGTNPFLRHYSGRREHDLKQDLTDHFTSVAEDLAPLMETDADTFDQAMRDAYPDRSDAEDVLEQNFGYIDTITDYTDGMDVKLGPLTLVDFSTDIQPVIEQGQRRLERKIARDLDDIYG